MKSGQTSYAFRLPASLKAEAEQLAEADGTSLNQFMMTAVAEKISARRAFDFWASRKGKSNAVAFAELMSRDRGEAPQPGDEIPPEYLARRAAEKRAAPVNAPSPAAPPQKARSKSAHRRSPRA